MSRREKMESMLQDSPEDVFLNYAFAMELAKEGEIQEARAAFAKVRTLQPEYVPAYFQEAQMLAQDDQINEAREILEIGIKVAQETGDDHALGEMTEFAETL